MNRKQKFARALWRLLPRHVVVNQLFALPRFLRHHQRFPRSLTSPKATLEDYVFDRMGKSWSSMVQSCVDKETAKVVASVLSPQLRVARTIAVFKVKGQTTLEDVGRFLYPFVGKNLVAKPTHASGGIVFLNQDISKIVKQAVWLFRVARENFFFRHYETQYRDLSLKIIVEENLGAAPPPDFRFYCAKGKVLFCQFDRDRFGDHRQAIFSTPEFKHIPIRDIFTLPEPLPEKPPHWGQMLQTASELSEPFSFVRVDLYDLPEGVFFSEFTFTPNAAVFPFSDPVFNRRLLEEVLSLNPKY